MPWRRVGGMMMHLRMDKRAAAKLPPPCPFWRWERHDCSDGITSERVKVRCMAMAPYLCDWPGCDVPFCGDHRLNLGPELDVCPTHNHVRGLFSRLLPAPASEIR